MTKPTWECITNHDEFLAQVGAMATLGGDYFQGLVTIVDPPFYAYYRNGVMYAYWIRELGEGYILKESNE
jgi:hypothetical protein